MFRPDLFHDKKATHGDCQSPKRINWQAGACNTYPEDELGLAALSAAILMGSLPAGTSMAHAASLFRVQQRRRAVDRAARHQRSGQGRTGTTAAAGMERWNKLSFAPREGRPNRFLRLDGRLLFSFSPFGPEKVSIWQAWVLLRLQNTFDPVWIPRLISSL